MDALDESTNDLTENLLRTKVLSGEYKIIRKRGRSKVWNIFASIEVEDGYVLPNFLVCRSCFNIYRYSRKSTSNLVKHKCYVNAKATNSFIISEDDDNNTTNVDPQNSPAVAESAVDKTTIAESKNSFTVPNIAADNAAELFTKWSITNCRPVEIAKDAGLKEIAKFFVSVGVKFGRNVDIMTYIPSPTMISHNVESMYKINADKVRSEISTIVDVGYGLTSDLWTNTFLRKSYLALTIHFVKDGSIYSRLLGLQSMDSEGDTTKNVHAKVVELLSDFGCTLNNKAIMVTRMGSNMVRAFRFNNQLHCINHLLQNTLQKSMEEMKEISNMCKLSTELVNYLKKAGSFSNLATNLKSFTPTRWNTFYYLFLYIKNNWNEITQLMQEKNELHRISGIDVSLLTSTIEVLELFEEALKKLEDEKCPTLHLVVVHIDKLLRTCSSKCDDILIIKLFKEKILSHLQNMVLKNLSIFHKIALFLFPPANKLLKFDIEEKEAIRKATEKIMSDFTENLNASIPANAIISEKNCDLFGRFVTQQDPIYSSSRVAEELTMYENTTIHFYSEFDVLKWWDTNKNQFPLLYKTSCRVLAVPASNAASETVFSAARHLLTENKCVLDCDLKAVNNIMFLHYNDFS